MEQIESALENAPKLHWADYLVIGIYFAGLLGIGYWSSRKSKGYSVSSYFLADKSMNWIVVGASLFASNIGSEHFVGQAGSGASSGIGVAGFELHAMYMLLLLGWFFLPVYLSAGIQTVPEYLRLRFGGQRIRVYLSVLALILYIFTKISADIYAGALFIKQALGLNMYISVVVLLAIAAVFTIVGGLNAVMWTDFAQTVLMIMGALVLTVLSTLSKMVSLSSYHILILVGLIEVGGYQSLMDNFMTRSQPTNESYISRDANNQSCSAVTKYYKNLLRPTDDEELPWLGVVLGITVNSVWYWCADQVIVQRALSARNLSHAKLGCVLCSFIKITPLYLLVLPGMAARVLWPNELGCSNPEMCKSICGSEAGCTNIAYPLLVLRLMPMGASGLMLSVMIAALMSSLTSIFNSASTLFTIDIYKRFRKSAGDVEQVIVGRLFILFLTAISIIWIPIVESSQNSQLFHYIQSVTSYLAPPVCAVYVLALFWSRVNESGAFWGLMLGLVVGIVRFAMEFSYSAPICGSGLDDPRPTIISQVNYLYFGVILYAITTILTVVISLLTQPIDEKHLYRLTFWTKYSEEVREDIESIVSNGNFNEGFVSDLTSPEEKNKHAIGDIEHGRKRNFLHTICCVGSQSDDDQQGELNIVNAKASKEELAVKAANEAKEEPMWSNINNIGALLVIAVASFLWGYYA